MGNETGIPGLGIGMGIESLMTLGIGTNIAGTVSGQKSLGQPNPKFLNRLGSRVPSSPKNSGCPKVVPWDTNPWDSWDWDKNRWDSSGILSFGT